MPSASSRPSSATGRPATPYTTTPHYRYVLILNGRFAQHVARVKQTHRAGRVDVIVEYGHVRGCSGTPLSLTAGDFVSTESHTCPALPKPPSFAEPTAAIAK